VIKVLYVHHAAPFGGASRSLFELLRAFPEGTVQPYALTRRGQFGSMLQSAGIDVIECAGVAQFDNTRYSYYRGLRWLVLLRELAYLPATLLGLLMAKRRWWQVDLVHVNDLTLIPVIWFAKKLFKCPIVVHVRSVQRPLDDMRGKVLYSLIKNNVDRLIAIDQTVNRSLSNQLNSVVIHNGLAISEEKIFDSDSVSRKVFTVGMVGGLSRAKGCIELIEAAKICHDRGASIRFVFVGQSMRPPAPLRDFILRRLGISQEIYQEMQNLIKTHALDSMVEFWPFTTELEGMYGKLDLVCFPSHLDAPGRPIFEAALFGIPSIAAISQPTSDTILNGVTGLTIPPRSPDQLAEAIMTMYGDPLKRKQMGENAKKLAQENFDITKSAQKMLALYRSLVKASI